MKNKYREIVDNGIDAVSEVLLGADMIEKEHLLNFLFGCFDPYFLGYIENRAYQDKIFEVIEKVIVGNSSKECKEEAIQILAHYTSAPFKTIEENIDKIEAELLPDIKYLLATDRIVAIGELLFIPYYDTAAYYIEVGNTGIKGEIIIPADIDGIPVTTIHSYAFDSCDKITKITIPKSISVIEKHAFNGCRYITVNTPHARKPDGWDADWKPKNSTVNWNCEE